MNYDLAKKPKRGAKDGHFGSASLFLTTNVTRIGVED
jgi:hypothetical protein